MSGIARQRNGLFSHAVKTDCYMWICFFAADRNELPARRLFCILKLFDRILATSCFSAKTDTCFKITEFMFHNHKIIQTNDKVQPLPFAKN